MNNVLSIRLKLNLVEMWSYKPHHCNDTASKYQQT